MKFKGLLFCTDLDGTLYRHDKTISEENKRAIEYFKSEGGLFTFITGRMPYYSQTAYTNIEPNAPFGCTNGGGVYDHRTQKYLWMEELDPSFVVLVKHVLSLMPHVGVSFQGFYHSYFASDNPATERFRQVTGVAHRICSCDNLPEPMGKAMFHVTCEEDMQRVQELLLAHPLAKDFGFIRSERSLFEILPKGLTKGTAILKLAELLNIDPKKTIATGDYNNDVPMFKSAGLGIAVANACEEAKAAADHITVSNEEHAIAKVIYDIESGALKI